MTDIELLNQHRNGSDSAFADLVRRHLAWIYGVARRRLNDSHLAEDVAQAVFVLLHRKSPQFTADRAMMSWLYKTACYASESAARTERRRQNRESKVAMSRPESTEPAQTPQWQELAPMLDQLIGRLSRPDREAILLRYYRDLSFAEVAEQIGATPDAARKRVERAVEKLRQLASERGNALSAASLASGLATLVRVPLPPGLIATATTAATAPAGSAITASTAGIVKGTLTMMATTKFTIVSLTTLAILLIGGLISGAAWMLADAQTQPSAAQAPTTAPAPLPAAPAQPPVPFDANGPIPKLAPFSAIRWHGNIPEVQVNQTWYELIAFDDLPVNQIFNFQRDTGDPAWRKHFGEDLVEILMKMHRQVYDTANLQVRTLDASKTMTTLQNIPMTADNRSALMNWPAPDQTSLFQGFRSTDSYPQVEENDTWYDLIAIDNIPIEKIRDSAQAAYGKDWQNHNAMEILDMMGHTPQLVSELRLRTLDTLETVTLTVRVPQKN